MEYVVRSQTDRLGRTRQERSTNIYKCRLISGPALVRPLLYRARAVIRAKSSSVSRLVLGAVAGE